MIVLDAGPLVALVDRREQHHAWASRWTVEIGSPLWTCGAVLSETCFLLAKRPHAIDRLHNLLHREVIRSVGESAALWERAAALMERYANVPMSFADAPAL